MTEKSFVTLESQEIKIAFNISTKTLFEEIRERSFETFDENSITDGLTLMYAEMVTAYNEEDKEPPYTMESFLFRLTSQEAITAVKESQKVMKLWKYNNEKIKNKEL